MGYINDLGLPIESGTVHIVERMVVIYTLWWIHRATQPFVSLTHSHVLRAQRRRRYYSRRPSIRVAFALGTFIVVQNRKTSTSWIPLA